MQKSNGLFSFMVERQLAVLQSNVLQNNFFQVDLPLPKFSPILEINQIKLKLTQQSLIVYEKIDEHINDGSFYVYQLQFNEFKIQFYFDQEDKILKKKITDNNHIYDYERFLSESTKLALRTLIYQYLYPYVHQIRWQNQQIYTPIYLDFKTGLHDLFERSLDSESMLAVIDKTIQKGQQLKNYFTNKSFVKKNMEYLVKCKENIEFLIQNEFEYISDIPLEVEEFDASKAEYIAYFNLYQQTNEALKEFKNSVFLKMEDAVDFLRNIKVAYLDALRVENAKLWKRGLHPLEAKANAYFEMIKESYKDCSEYLIRELFEAVEDELILKHANLFKFSMMDMASELMQKAIEQDRVNWVQFFIEQVELRVNKFQVVGQDDKFYSLLVAAYQSRAVKVFGYLLDKNASSLVLYHDIPLVYELISLGESNIFRQILLQKCLPAKEMNPIFFETLFNFVEATIQHQDMSKLSLNQEELMGVYQQKKAAFDMLMGEFEKKIQLKKHHTKLDTAFSNMCSTFSPIEIAQFQQKYSLQNNLTLIDYARDVMIYAHELIQAQPHQFTIKHKNTLRLLNQRLYEFQQWKKTLKEQKLEEVKTESSLVSQMSFFENVDKYENIKEARFMRP